MLECDDVEQCSRLVRINIASCAVVRPGGAVPERSHASQMPACQHSPLGRSH